MYRSICVAVVVAAAAFSGPAFAQDQSKMPASPSVTTAPAAVHLTADQAKAWIGKPVYSSDNVKLGDVAEFVRGSNDNVTELHANIGGFLGIGESHVKIMPAQFQLGSDRVILNQTSTQAKSLPKIDK